MKAACKAINSIFQGGILKQKLGLLKLPAQNECSVVRAGLSLGRSKQSQVRVVNTHYFLFSCSFRYCREAGGNTDYYTDVDSGNEDSALSSPPQQPLR